MSIEYKSEVKEVKDYFDRYIGGIAKSFDATQVMVIEDGGSGKTIVWAALVDSASRRIRYNHQGVWIEIWRRDAWKKDDYDSWTDIKVMNDGKMLYEWSNFK